MATYKVTLDTTAKVGDLDYTKNYSIEYTHETEDYNSAIYTDLLTQLTEYRKKKQSEQIQK